MRQIRITVKRNLNDYKTGIRSVLTQTHLHMLNQNHKTVAFLQFGPIISFAFWNKTI